MNLYMPVRREGGGYNVVRDDGRVICKRTRLVDADEVAHLLSLGKKYPTEIQQVLASWPVMRIEVREDMARPFRIVDNYGICVTSYKYRHLAEWWLKDYRARKRVALSAEEREHEGCGDMPE